MMQWYIKQVFSLLGSHKLKNLISSMYRDLWAGIVIDGSPQPFFPSWCLRPSYSLSLWYSLTHLAAKPFSLSVPQEPTHFSVSHGDIPVWFFHVLHGPVCPSIIHMGVILCSTNVSCEQFHVPLQCPTGPVFSMRLPLCTHPLSHVDIPVGPSRVACGPMNTPSAMETPLVVPNVKAAGPRG